MVGVDLESVYCYLLVDFGHALVGPSKAILVLLEELDECESEFGVEAHSNLVLVVQVIGMNADIVELIYTQMIRLRMLNRGRL